MSVAWPTGVQLLVFFCSSVPVVLFDTPGISRCQSQHVVSVESLSLFHHSIYLSSTLSTAQLQLGGSKHLCVPVNLRLSIDFCKFTSMFTLWKEKHCICDLFISRVVLYYMTYKKI